MCVDIHTPLKTYVYVHACIFSPLSSNVLSIHLLTQHIECVSQWFKAGLTCLLHETASFHFCAETGAEKIEENELHMRTTPI